MKRGGKRHKLGDIVDNARIVPSQSGRKHLRAMRIRNVGMLLNASACQISAARDLIIWFVTRARRRSSRLARRRTRPGGLFCRQCQETRGMQDGLPEDGVIRKLWICEA